MLIPSLGSLEHLLSYETKRQQSVVPMITAIDALKRLYSTSSTLPVLARSVGLIATSALPPIKVIFSIWIIFFLIKVTNCRSKGLGPGYCAILLGKTLISLTVPLSTLLSK